jgi:hypothetical protein
MRRSRQALLVTDKDIVFDGKAQTRRHASKQAVARGERELTCCWYSPTIRACRRHSTLPRRSYMLSHSRSINSAEYRFVRNDLFRILVWASLLIGAMVVLSFLSIF